MTKPANARLAGATFLVYIAVGIAGMLRAPGPLVRIVSSLAMALSAFVLGVTLYALTRDEDADIALLALTCRVAEGVLGTVLISARLALQAVDAAADPTEAASLHALEAFVLRARGLNTVVGATFFAVGSALFCWLFLRGRVIPAALAWLGLISSIVLAVGLPLQLAGLVRGAATQLIWIPMAAFEIPAGVWLLVNAARLVTPRRADA